MKGRKNKQEKLSPLRKSSALILLYPNVNSDTFKTVLLKRKSQMSFGNSYVLPGGVCDQEDIMMARSNEFIIYSKVTAIRQFLEETGILVYPSSAENKIRNNSFRDITEVINQIGTIWEGNLGLLQPVFRTLTPQTIKGKRFDCLFHLCVVSKLISILNISLLLKKTKVTQRSFKKVLKESQTNQLTDLNCTTIIFNSNESDDIIFDTPQNIVKRHSKQDIFIFPPQLILMASLTNLCSLKYRDELMKYSTHCSKNQFDFIEPIMFQMEMNNLTLLKLFGDKNYKHEEVIIKQVSSSSKQDLIKYFNEKINQNIVNTNGQRVIYIGEQIYIVSNYQQQDSKCFLKYLISKSNPQQQIIEIKSKL